MSGGPADRVWERGEQGLLRPRERMKGMMPAFITAMVQRKNRWRRARRAPGGFLLPTTALFMALLASCAGGAVYNGCFGAEEWLPAPAPRVRTAAVEVMRALHFEPRDGNSSSVNLISRPRIVEHPAEYPFYSRLKERVVVAVVPETSGTRVKLALLSEGLGADGWVSFKTNRRRDYDRFLDLLRQRLGLEAESQGTGSLGSGAPRCGKPQP